MKIKYQASKAGIFAVVFLFEVSTRVQAQFVCATNNGAVSITGYAGNPTKLSVPSVTNGYPVTSIGFSAFANLTSLTTVVLPGSITNVGNGAFGGCPKLTGVYFEGNAPSLGGADLFFEDAKETIYRLPGTTGWVGGAFFYPTVLWNPQAQVGDGSFGVGTNGFGFNIAGSSNLVVVVEACTNLANPVWSAVGTNSLTTLVGTNGVSYFSDAQWTNYGRRFYRFRSP